MSMAWGGHKNGQIPASALTSVDGYLFEREAARQLVPLRAAFKKRFNKNLIINDDYRPLWEQVDNWNKWVAYRNYLNGGKWAPWAPLAAYYGASNHGWGKAADFGSGVQTFGTAEKKWMDANAPKYGWHPTGNKFSRPEAWHFDYLGNPTIVAGDGHTVITEEEEENEDEDMVKNSGFYYNKGAESAKHIVVLICNTGSGFEHEFSNGAGKGFMPGDYNNDVAASFGTGGFAKISEKHAADIKAALAVTRGSKNVAVKE